MPKALHRHPSKRRRTAREKKRPWTTEPQPTASRKHKYPGAHVERRGRMRTTQAPGDRTLLGLFCFTLDLERDIQKNGPPRRNAHSWPQSQASLRHKPIA